MRVVLETNALYVSRAGVARSVRLLRDTLHRVCPADNELEELAWEVENFGYQQPQRALRTAYRELFWSRVVAPARLRTAQAAVYHATHGWLVRPPKNIPHVVTLHDLAVLRHPERFRRWHRSSAARRLQSLHEADAIVCPSEFTAREAMDLLHLPRERLHIIPWGPGMARSVQEPRRPRALPVLERYFLFVGSLEPGKNLTLLREIYRQGDLPPLIIVGERWPGVTQEGPPPANWHFMGRINDAELAWLYQHARGLLFPSIYEGFGFPVLEAMHCGCPVVCRPSTALPEVAGQAAVMPDASAEAWQTAAQKLAEDEEHYAQLRNAGKAQAAKFSWEACARAHWQLYAEVAAGKRS